MSSKKSKLLESAQKNFLKGLYGRAADEYRQIIQIDPIDTRHRQRLAEILVKANQKEEATKEYILLAKHYIDSVYYLKAIAVYKQIQKLDPTNPEISITLATLNEKQGLIGNATAEYVSAVQLYEKKGENLKALKTLESILALEPSNSAVRLRIAEKYFVTGSEEKSFNEFATLLRDIKERNDENGFRLISEKVSNLFGDKAEKLISTISEEQTDIDLTIQPSPQPPAEERSKNTDNNPPEIPVPAGTFPELPFETDLTADASNAILYEDIEPIDDIMPLDEDDDQVKAHTTGNEEDWEEEIDLAALNSELPSTADQYSARDVIEELDLAVDLDEMELDELELEIEEYDDSESASEPLALFDVPSRQTDEYFDLGKELSFFADEIDFDLFKAEETDSPFDFAANSGFKKGELDNEDSESHYSLGLAYKEMGLFDEAIAEFIVASRSVKRLIDSSILMGVCLREIGNVDKAVEILSDTLQHKSMTEDEYLGLQYELALCHEASGELNKARQLFTDINRARPAFSDVVARLKKLQD